MFHWTKDSVRWMRDAANRSETEARIATWIGARLPKNARVLDAGCGLGALAVRFSPYAASVTGIDLDPRPLAALSDRLPENVRLLPGDVLTMAFPERFDALVCSFFGSPAEVLALSEKTGAALTFAVGNADATKHRYALSGGSMRHSLEPMRRALDEAGIPYTSDTLTVEELQPLASEADAVRFFERYGRSGEPVTFRAVEDRLSPGTDEAFPYLVKTTRRLALLAFSIGENRSEGCKN